MRKIAFLQLKGSRFSEAILNLCSDLTPLVETLEAQVGQIYLDISGCGLPGKLLTTIAAAVYKEVNSPVEIGLASSKLLAYSAINIQRLPLQNPVSPEYRLIKRREVKLVQVLSGHEQKFLGIIPLKDFPPLSPGEARKLIRTGLNTVGDVAALSLSQLQALLGKNAYTLHENIRGIDKTPVMGLYPPDHIIYPLSLSEDDSDLLIIGQQIKTAGQALESTLAQRNCGFGCLRLELQTPTRHLELERKLSDLCYRAESLVNITMQLFKKAEIKEVLQAGIIKLYAIAPLNWQEQDLFSIRPVYQAEQKHRRLDSALVNLEDQFPGMLFKGQEINRREQLLSLWDPWRQG